MNVFASDNFRYFSRATHVYFCEVARNCHALRTSLSFAEWSCKMSLLVIQNPPYVGGEISNSRLHNDLRDVRFLAIARWEPGVPGIGKFSESSCVRVFRCDTTDVCQTELAIIFAMTVNCYSQLHVLQGEVPCSFRSFRHRIVSMYNRRGHDELFGHHANTFSRVGFHVGVSILGQWLRPTSQGGFSTDNNCRHALTIIATMPESMS